jgi:hypothetical protein
MVRAAFSVGAVLTAGICRFFPGALSAGGMLFLFGI